MKRLISLATSIAIVAGTLGTAATANATTFFAWQVTDVKWGDTLNVRRWPAPHSQKRGAYPNGTVLQMTGKCKNAPTLLSQIAGMEAWKQRDIVRYMWCEVFHSPASNNIFEPGWVYMKYAKPLTN
ncbi:MAG: SH3 domain-containing protein [Pseudomonadota bacterium]